MHRAIVIPGSAAILAGGLVLSLACQGHVEKNAKGEVTSVGLKTDPEVTEKVREAGREARETGRAVGREVRQDVREAAQAVRQGARDAKEAVQDTAKEAEQAAQAGVEKSQEVVKEGVHAVRSVATDTAIATKIKAKYVADPELHGLAIEVKVREGKVTLRGTVQSAVLKDEAARLARETAGVAEVVNDLSITGGR